MSWAFGVLLSLTSYPITLGLADPALGGVCLYYSNYYCRHYTIWFFQKGTCMYSAMLALCAAVAGASSSINPVAPSARDILSHVQTREASLSNATLKVTWKDLSDGKLNGWEEQTFFWDNLKRRRLVTEHGFYSPEGKRMHPTDRFREDFLYDGEVVIDLKEYFNRNRSGATLSTPQQSIGYRAAIIADGKASLRQNLEAHRNPHDYLRNTAVSELSERLEKGQSVTVRVPDPARRVYALEYAEPAGSDAGYSQSVATVDADKGWAVTGLTSYDTAGKVVRTITIDYRPQDDQFWVPAFGSHKHWGDRAVTEAPVFEWRFTVSEARFNDPKFDQGVFRVVLDSDTAISDTRFNVAYRVGAEKAANETLSRLAQQAQSEDATAVTTARPRSMWYRLWVFATAGLTIAVICYLAYTRVSRSAPSSSP